MAAEINDLFTMESLATLAGSTGATFAVTNGLGVAFNFARKWLGLAVAQIICIAIVYFTGGAGSDYFVAVLNGFLVFCAAAGAAAGAAPGGAQVLARGGHFQGGNEAEDSGGGNDRRFLSRWF